MSPRFNQLRDAFNCMIGRSQMSRKMGNTKRAYFQVLAASRIYSWMLKL